MKTGRRRVAVAWSVAVCCMSGSVSARQLPTFRAGVDLVRLDVLVRDRQRAVTGLVADDFVVVDNGVVQPVSALTVEQAPVDVVLALDTSNSVRGEKLRRLLEAARLLVAEVDARDRVGLLTFNERVMERVPLTEDISQVATALTLVTAEGATSLFDAVFAALVSRHRPGARPVVLLFSDGRDTTSWLKSDDVVQLARERTGVVYSVTLLASDVERPLLRDLAEATGGRLMVADSDRQLKTMFTTVIREIKTRYLLSYTLNGVGREGDHAVSVSLRRRPGEVLARKSYFLGTRTGRQ